MGRGDLTHTFVRFPQKLRGLCFVGSIEPGKLKYIWLKKFFLSIFYAFYLRYLALPDFAGSAAK